MSSIKQHTIRGDGLTGLPSLPHQHAVPCDVSLRTTVARGRGKAAAAAGPLVALYEARRHARAGQLAEARALINGLPRIDLLDRSSDHGLLLATTADHPDIASIFNAIGLDSQIVAIDHAFRPPVDSDRIHTFERLAQRFTATQVRFRYHARMLQAMALDRLPFRPAVFESTVRALSDGPMRTWAHIIGAASNRRLDLVTLDGLTAKRDAARERTLYETDDAPARADMDRLERELELSRCRLDVSTKSAWQALVDTDFELESQLSSDSTIAKSLRPLFTPQLGSEANDLFKLSFVAWRKLAKLQSGRGDPDLEAIGGLLVSFRTVLERLLHLRVTRKLKVRDDLPPGKIKDALGDRTTLGIGLLYSLLYSPQSKPDTRAFHDAVMSEPRLAPLLSDEARTRFRELQLANLSGSHHDEAVSKATWRKVFAAVRHAMFDDLAKPTDNQGLVKLLSGIDTGSANTGRGRG